MKKILSGTQNIIKDYVKHVKSLNRNVKLYLLAVTFIAMTHSVIMVFYSIYLEESGYPKSRIGIILGAFTLGMLINSFIAPLIVSKIKTKYLLVVNAVLYSIGTILMTQEFPFEALFVIALLTGLTRGMSNIIAAPFLMKNTDKKNRKYAFALERSILMISRVLIVFFAGNISEYIQFLGVSKEFSLQVVVIGSAFVCLISLIPYIKMKGADISEHSVKGDPVKLQAMKLNIKGADWGTLMKIFIPRTLVGFGSGLIIPYMSLYLTNVFTSSYGEVGLIQSLTNVMTFVGMNLTPVISGRFGMVNSIVSTQLLSMPFMLILAMTDHLWLAVPSLLLRGALMNMGTPISNNFSMEIVTENQRTLANSVRTIGWLGSRFIATMIGGSVIEIFGFDTSFYIAIGLYFASSILFYVFLKKKEEEIPHHT
jgi:MFS family permease